MNKKHSQAIEGEAKAKPEVTKLGLDLHVQQVTECRQLGPKPAQQWGPWKLLDQIKGWVKAGIKVYSCYEAGVCGYWYHRELITGPPTAPSIPHRREGDSQSRTMLRPRRERESHWPPPRVGRDAQWAEQRPLSARALPPTPGCLGV
jgi:hypothetical protein